MATDYAKKIHNHPMFNSAKTTKVKEKSRFCYIWQCSSALRTPALPHGEGELSFLPFQMSPWKGRDPRTNALKHSWQWWSQTKLKMRRLAGGGRQWEPEELNQIKGKLQYSFNLSNFIQNTDFDTASLFSFNTRAIHIEQIMHCISNWQEKKKPGRKITFQKYSLLK